MVKPLKASSIKSGLEAFLAYKDAGSDKEKKYVYNFITSNFEGEIKQDFVKRVVQYNSILEAKEKLKQRILDGI